VLLTRSRLCPRPKPGSSLHLHVLSTPPAFVLSQDQTLRERLAWCLPARRCRAGSTVLTRERQASRRVHHGEVLDGFDSYPSPAGPADSGRTWTLPRADGSRSHMLLSFQRPSRPRRGLRRSSANRTKKASRGRPAAWLRGAALSPRPSPGRSSSSGATCECSTARGSRNRVQLRS
jgi:hypothetical protein